MTGMSNVLKDSNSLFENRNEQQHEQEILAFERRLARSNISDVLDITKLSKYDEIEQKEPEKKPVELNGEYAIEFMNGIERLHPSHRRNVTYEQVYQRALSMMGIEQINKLNRTQIFQLVDRIVWAIARENQAQNT